jgi:hypothetical protein
VTLGEQVVAFIAVLCVTGALKMPAAEPFACSGGPVRLLIHACRTAASGGVVSRRSRAGGRGAPWGCARVLNAQPLRDARCYFAEAAGAPQCLAWLVFTMACL